MNTVHTGAGNGVYARSKIFHNGSSASLHSQYVGDFEDHILRRGPAIQLPVTL